MISRIKENMNIASRRFLHNHGNIATEGSPKPGLCRALISNEDKKEKLNWLHQSLTDLTESIIHWIDWIYHSLNWLNLSLTELTESIIDWIDRANHSLIWLNQSLTELTRSIIDWIDWTNHWLNWLNQLSTEPIIDWTDWINHWLNWLIQSLNYQLLLPLHYELWHGCTHPWHPWRVPVSMALREERCY